MIAAPGKIAIENFNHPGWTGKVDAEKYRAVRTAILAVLPVGAPGLTLVQWKKQVVPLLPEALFPDGAKAGWWMMGVQLDLRAKQLIVAEDTKPLRFHRT